MIYTLTTNPAIDLNLTGQGIAPNQVNRTGSVIYSPNGKGVNVSLVLKHFQRQSVALGFFGGFTGRYIIDELAALEVASKPVWIEETTRLNVFVSDGGDEYKFVNAGPHVSKEKQNELIEILCSLNDCKYLVISGSLPQGVSSDYYDRIFRLCSQKNCEVILDISSPKLKDLLTYKPLLIKPNDEEIAEIYNVSINDESDVVSVLSMLHNSGARNILLTMGDKGAYFSDSRNIFYSSAQPVKLVSSACAGDAALGAFLSVWLYGDELAKALKLSAATGANVAESNALGDFQNVSRYFENIKIRKVV